MKKGDICLVDLKIQSGHEQGGARPAILISDTETNIAIVIPLTSNLNALKFIYTLAILPDKQNNLDKESVALIFHIKSIDRVRILKTIGKIDKNSQNKIDKILKNMLKI